MAKYRPLAALSAAAIVLAVLWVTSITPVAAGTRSPASAVEAVSNTSFRIGESAPDGKTHSVKMLRLRRRGGVLRYEIIYPAKPSKMPKTAAFGRMNLIVARKTLRDGRPEARNVQFTVYDITLGFLDSKASEANKTGNIRMSVGGTWEYPDTRNILPPRDATLTRIDVDNTAAHLLQGLRDFQAGKGDMALTIDFTKSGPVLTTQYR